MEQSGKAHPGRSTRAFWGPRAPLVMIADDAEDAREVYGQYLAQQGYRVVTAEDGVDALLRVRTSRPDIILMDLQMPRLDGWEAIRQLKSDPRTASIPVVAVSAYAHDSERSAARAAGADASLTKPCMPPQLLMMVRAMLLWRAAAVTEPGPAQLPGSYPLPVLHRLTRTSQQKTEM
jgi:chemosensory pili system protein ChpA (sensor histidine kinase/response regulator)